MNKKLVLFLLITNSLPFCCLLTYNNAASDETLARISTKSQDVVRTETLNKCVSDNSENYSLLQSFKSTMPLVCYCMGGHLLWKSGQAFMYGCGFTYEDDPSNKTWFICDQQGKKHIITRVDIRTSLLIDGGLWVVMSLGHYIYQKHAGKAQSSTD